MSNGGLVGTYAPPYQYSCSSAMPSGMADFSIED